MQLCVEYIGQRGMIVNELWKKQRQHEVLSCNITDLIIPYRPGRLVNHNNPSE